MPDELKDEKPIDLNKPVEQAKETQKKVEQAVKKETAPPYVRTFRTIVFQAYVIAAISGFAVLAMLARTTPVLAADVTITRDLQLFNQAWFSTLMDAISWPGFAPQAVPLTLLIIGLLFYFGLRWEATVAMLAAFGSQVVNYAFKIGIARPRPTADLVHVVQQLSSYSFPSGHVMYYTAFFGFIFFLVFTLLKPSWWRALLLFISGALVLLVGVSRIYLGEHWASDVTAGYLMGSLTLIIAIWFYRWGKGKFFKSQKVAPEKV